MKYEYLKLDSPMPAPDIDKLNELGQSGWHIVGCWTEAREEEIEAPSEYLYGGHKGSTFTAKAIIQHTVILLERGMKTWQDGA